MATQFSDSMSKNQAYDEWNAMQRNYGGPNEPANPVPHQWWPDETSGFLKQRNAANTEWINRGSLSLPNFGLTPIDGWNSVNATLSYASATTMNINTDLTGIIPQYAKIRWKQGGDFKFAYLTSITATLWTVNGGVDYSVANAAITDVAWSGNDYPTGFPLFIAYSYPVTGISGVATFTGRFRMNGNKVEVILDGFTGAATDSPVTVGLPIRCINGIDTPVRILNNGVGLWGMVEPNHNAATIYAGIEGAPFSTTGTNGVLTGSRIEYYA